MQRPYDPCEGVFNFEGGGIDAQLRHMSYLYYK